MFVPFVLLRSASSLQIGRPQQTIARCIEKSGTALHSGDFATVKVWPENAGKGRYFDFRSTIIPASIDYVENSSLCTALRKDGHSVRTVEHLLSALEASGVDNCRVEIFNHGLDDAAAEVPIFDGSAREWVEAIEQVGLTVARDCNGNSCEKLAPFLNEPIQVSKNDSFLAAFPSPKVDISYGINFVQVPVIGCQWFSASHFCGSFYAQQIAPSRTFCIYEEVEKMRNLGLIKGGLPVNAVVFSATEGLLNPPLRSPEEPCRHKMLDLIGDLSLFARAGSQGIPVAHIVAYKGGHALHADFVRRISTTNSAAMQC